MKKSTTELAIAAQALAVELMPGVCKKDCVRQQQSRGRYVAKLFKYDEMCCLCAAYSKASEVQSLLEEVKRNEEIQRAPLPPSPLGPLGGVG